MARVPQWRVNLSKELQAATDPLYELSFMLLVPDVADPTVEVLKETEDQLIGALILVRQIRHKLTATPLMEKGQRV